MTAGRTAVLALALALALVLVPLAAADGDPASDTLLVEDVYVPYPPPSRDVARRLANDVADAYAHGYRLKVAVIATTTDLGAIPSLYGKPNQYARFLGREIQFYYGGPLLIVMPAGFGIYDRKRPTGAEEAVLRRVPVKARSVNELTATADAAVRALVAAHALVSKDITPPYIAVVAATGKRGQKVAITFYVSDDSKHATATFQVLDGKRPLLTRHFRYSVAILRRTRTIRWLVPRSTRRGLLQACLTASDPAGNRSPRTCADLKIL